MKKKLENEYVTLIMDKQKLIKYMKYYEENKESLYLKYWDVNNLNGLAISQNLPVNGFEWVPRHFSI